LNSFFASLLIILTLFSNNQSKHTHTCTRYMYTHSPHRPSIHPSLPSSTPTTKQKVDWSELAKRNNEFLKHLNIWVFGVASKLIPCVLLTYLSLALIRVLIEADERKQRLHTKIPIPPSVSQANSQYQNQNNENQRRPTLTLSGISSQSTVTAQPTLNRSLLAVASQTNSPANRVNADLSINRSRDNLIDYNSNALNAMNNPNPNPIQIESTVNLNGDNSNNQLISTPITSTDLCLLDRNNNLFTNNGEATLETNPMAILVHDSNNIKNNSTSHSISVTTDLNQAGNSVHCNNLSAPVKRHSTGFMSKQSILIIKSRKETMRGSKAKSSSKNKSNAQAGTTGTSTCSSTSDRTTKMLLCVLLIFLLTEFPSGILVLLSSIIGKLPFAFHLLQSNSFLFFSFHSIKANNFLITFTHLWENCSICLL
jgi:hypothetical protein